MLRNIVIFVTLKDMKSIYYILCVVVLAFSYSCRKEKASWSTKWIAPIAKDTLRISDYVNDSTLSVNNDQSIQVILERDLVDFDITDILDIPDTTIEQTFSIAVSNLNLAPGTTFIDDIQENTFTLEGAALTEVRLSSGTATVRIVNPLSEGGIFLIELPGVTKDNVLFSQSEYVEGGSLGNPSTKTFELDLSGYTIDMTGESGLSYNILQSKMTVTTDPNGTSVNVTNQDFFEFIVKFENLNVEYGKGYFGQQVFSDTTTLNIDALRVLAGGDINVENVDFDIILFNGIKATAQAEITKMTSVNYAGDEIELNHPYFDQMLNINPAQWDWNTLTPSEKVLTFDQSSTNIIPFIENLGDEYELGYKIELNPLGNTSGGNDELFPESRIGAKIIAGFPLVLGANDLTLRDTLAFSLEDRDRLLDIEVGEFILATNNTFPYGGTVNLKILDEQYNELTTISQSSAIEPAALNTLTNNHINQSQETKFEVTPDDVSTFGSAAYIEIEVVLNSTMNSNNVVYANSAIDFLLRANFQMKTNL